MKRIDLSTLGIIAAVCGAYVVLASVIGNTYYQHVLTIIAIFAVLGLSWNLLGGYAGVVSFGHAAFFGIGAFTVTLLPVVSKRPLAIARSSPFRFSQSAV